MMNSEQITKAVMAGVAGAAVKEFSAAEVVEFAAEDESFRDSLARFCEAAEGIAARGRAIKEFMDEGRVWGILDTGDDTLVSGAAPGREHGDKLQVVMDFVPRDQVIRAKILHKDDAEKIVAALHDSDNKVAAARMEVIDLSHDLSNELVKIGSVMDTATAAKAILEIVDSGGKAAN